VEERCLLCHKPVESLAADTCQCLEDLAAGDWSGAAWREALAQGLRGEEPPCLYLWAAYHASPPVPWRLLLRRPFVRWVLLFLLGLFAYELLCVGDG
jgi:hypothetical protein